MQFELNNIKNNNNKELRQYEKEKKKNIKDCTCSNIKKKFEKQNLKYY